MSRIRTSFKPGFEKLGDRLCLSGTPLEPIDFTAAPTAELGGHVKVFDGLTGAEVFSPYGGYLGGVRVACDDVDHADLGNDWIVGGTGRDTASVTTSAALHLKPLVGSADDNNHGTHVAGTIGAMGHSSGVNFVMSDGSVRFVNGDDLTVDTTGDQQVRTGKEYQHYTITLTDAG